jgi:hypothetical protein
VDDGKARYGHVEHAAAWAGRSPGALPGTPTERLLPIAPDRLAVSSNVVGGPAPAREQSPSDHSPTELRLQIVAVAQLAPQKNTKPGDQPLPNELADFRQFERAFPVAAVVSRREAKEFDAQSLAKALTESGQIPPGYRLVRVAKVQPVAASEQPDEPALKPLPLRPDTADPFRDDAPDRVTQGAGPSLSSLGFAPITKMTIDTRVRPDPKVTDEKSQQPKDEAAPLFRQFGEERDYMRVGDVWLDEGFFLEPARFCHQPLYFEEINLERYGTCARPLLQPVISGARFFATVPALPYLMTVHRPRACCYETSACLAGRPAPWHREFPPLQLDAAAVTALVATGMVFVLP